MLGLFFRSIYLKNPKLQDLNRIKFRIKRK